MSFTELTRAKLLLVFIALHIVCRLSGSCTASAEPVSKATNSPLSYEVEGTLDATFYNYSGPWKKFSNKFHLAVDSPRWKIKLQPDPQTNPGSPAYYETSCDGTNVFTFATFDPTASLTSSVIVHGGAIVEGLVPPPSYLDNTARVESRPDRAV
jgi:hypothetical protein